MALTMSEDDKRLIVILQQEGVLKPIRQEELREAANGAVAILCADGDQFYDCYSHAAGIVGFHRQGHPRIHPLTGNGSPLFLTSRSPIQSVVKKEKRAVLMHDFHEALNLKGIKIGLIINHVPCAIAYADKIGVLSLLKYTFYGEDELKAAAQTAKPIRCWLHLDTGEKKTYFISRQRYGQKYGL